MMQKHSCGKTTSDSHVFIEGMVAASQQAQYLDNEEIETLNPYPKGTKEFRAWMQGYVASPVRFF